MRKIFDINLIQQNDINMGITCRGDTLVSPSDKGSFSGKDIKGQVMPAGMGITYTPIAGSNDIESTLLLKTDDGVYIIMEMRAFLNMEDCVEQRLMEGDRVDPDEYYFKGTVRFRTDHDLYKWLERKVCVCVTEIINWEELKISVYMV